MYADDLIPDLRFSLSYLFEICLFVVLQSRRKSSHLSLMTF